MIDDKHNPKFVGKKEKFKYLDIHGYERWQRDKEGKFSDGWRQWIKDYCRKDSDPDYANLTVYQRYVLDGMRRLTGLHGHWPSNDPMWVVRGLCVGRKEVGPCAKAVRTLVELKLVTLSNEPLGSLDILDKNNKKEQINDNDPSNESTLEGNGEKPTPTPDLRSLIYQIIDIYPMKPHTEAIRKKWKLAIDVEIANKWPGEAIKGAKELLEAVQRYTERKDPEKTYALDKFIQNGVYQQEWIWKDEVKQSLSNAQAMLNPRPRPDFDNSQVIDLETNERVPFLVSGTHNPRYGHPKKWPANLVAYDGDYWRWNQGSRGWENLGPDEPVLLSSTTKQTTKPFRISDMADDDVLIVEVGKDEDDGKPPVAYYVKGGGSKSNKPKPAFTVDDTDDEDGLS